MGIVGAGPAGLVAARWLRECGFDPVLIEQADGVGGQWRVGSPFSSVWPGMRTNTSRITTAFSDLPHATGTPPYPTGEEIGRYLERYAAHFGLREGAHFNTRVEEIEPVDGRWRVRIRNNMGARSELVFNRVVVASGRYHQSFTPEVRGIETFAGSAGTSHVASYRGVQPFHGKRVLVAGHSISAVEVASELALKGAAGVILSARRHRFVFQKILAGVPIEHRVYTRYAAIASGILPAERSAESLKALILRTSGHPSQFGAPCHSDDPYEAGFTQNQYYLPLVAEGRITPRPWISRVEGSVVTFSDGTSDEVDAIVFGTGYALHLPFLGPTVRNALQPDAVHADLDRFTFHPALPGLAFAGIYEQSGPYFTPVEQQARWIAYSWSGRCPAPSRAEMERGIEAFRARRGQPQVQRMHVIARLFAGCAGVEPDPVRWPQIGRALMFGVMSPASFRLDGPDALADAATRTGEDALAFGALNDLEMTVDEQQLLAELTAAQR